MCSSAPTTFCRSEIAANKVFWECGIAARKSPSYLSTAPGHALLRNLTQIITYDAYHKAEAFLTQPILAVAGSNAGSKWMSDDLIARAASQDKQLYVVNGADHMDLYDVPKYVDEAVSKLAPFFQATLK